MFVKFRLFAIIITLIFGLNSTISKAQSTDVDPVQLIDYTIGDVLIFSFPDDWLVWARSDFETAEEAETAYGDFMEFLFDRRPDGSLVDSPLYFSAFHETDDIILLVQLEVHEIDVLATAISFLPEEMTPELMMQSFYPQTLVNRTYRVDQINGRSVASGAVVANDIFTHTTIVSFPDQNKLASITMRIPSGQIDWFLDNFYLMTVINQSVRLESETIDVESTEVALESDFPDHILLPEVEGQEETVVETEAADDVDTEDNADTEDDADTEVTVDCSVSASSNANLRGGPGTSFAVAGSLTGGTSIAAIGQATGNDGQVWWQLENNSWVRSDVVAEAGDCELLPVTTP